MALSRISFVTETRERLKDLGAYLEDETLAVPAFKSCLDDIRSQGIGSPVFADVSSLRPAMTCIPEIGERAPKPLGKSDPSCQKS